jgi:hypothetical protein
MCARVHTALTSNCALTAATDTPLPFCIGAALDVGSIENDVYIATNR